MSKPEICNHCGQKIKQAYKETLSKHKLTMLQTVARHVIATGVNDYDLKDMVHNHNDYTNFQKLRFHGLVHHVKDSAGNKVRGHWLITRNGWAFLRGQIELPKYVLVRENSIVERSPELIHVKDVYRGSEAITTVFEYFDDAGNMVGVRPIATHKTDSQMGLFS